MDEQFPMLAAEGYAATSPESVEYNCVAWAAGDTTRWWWPDAMELGYWPTSVPRQPTLNAFKQAFSLLGYVEAQSADAESAIEKIAIYARGDAPTHVARQLANGQWTSKLGASIDLSHTLTGLEGSLYGQVAAFMQRPRPAIES